MAGRDGSFSRRILVGTLVSFDQERPSLAWEHMWGGGSCFCGVSHVRILRGGAQASTKYFRIPTYAHTLWATATKFSTVTYGRMSYLCTRINRAPVQRVGPISVPKIYGTPNYAYTVWPRATKFGMITHVGRGVFLWGNHPPYRGTGPSVPEIFGTSYMRAYGGRSNNQFCIVIEIDERKILQGGPRTLSWPISCDMNAEARNLFTVANLLVHRDVF